MENYYSLTPNEFDEKDEKYIGKEYKKFANSKEELREGEVIMLKDRPNSRAVISKIGDLENNITIIAKDEQRDITVESVIGFTPNNFKRIIYENEDSNEACLRTAQNLLSTPESAKLFKSNASLIFYCKTKSTCGFDINKLNATQRFEFKSFLSRFRKNGMYIMVPVSYIADIALLATSPVGGLLLWLRENKGYRDYQDVLAQQLKIEEITKDEHDLWLRKRKNSHIGKDVGTGMGGIGGGAAAAYTAVYTLGFGLTGTIIVSAIGVGAAAFIGYKLGELIAYVWNEKIIGRAFNATKDLLYNGFIAVKDLGANAMKESVTGKELVAMKEEWERKFAIGFDDLPALLYALIIAAMQYFAMRP